ncbi:MAG TPA: Ig-like domain-containing protein [Actinophytocola sp.]|uniref:L,D-transpeptidase n=1 Tax=Actinophytocola sp. TaxID=1872138 RepID=UPI002DDCD224|nr:Ig-like domain-containing protein [Actinophytocola sp.]HEV2778020.1 Ig-like domain-containing protein [Actinophytocola sp.]
MNADSGCRWRRSTRLRGLLGALLAITLGLAACSSDDGGGQGGDDAQNGSPGGNQRVAPAAAKPAAAITLSPAAGAVDVSPTAPIAVAVKDGTIDSIALTNPDGKAVGGTLSKDRTSWAPSEPLGYDKTYTWSGSAVGADGNPVPITGAFTTVKPKRQPRAKINTGDGQTFGIAMPIAITFDAPITDKAAAQKALTVLPSVPTEGAWAWLDDRTVHWRPKAYWKPGTTVAVTAKLYGVAYGNGAYGREDLSSQFSIGRAQVVKANTRTHRWVVIRDGQQVADYPASFGLDSDPGRVTTSGIHVVMGKSPTYKMTNRAYGYEDFPVNWAVRLSNNGVFSHAAPWSVGDQGKRNVSHGCANLSPKNAKEFYDSAIIGDPVEIEGSTNPLSAKDGDYYDWAISWDKWLAKSAL